MDINQTGDDRWVFIINPVAGNGFARTLKDPIEIRIRQHGLKADIVFTDYHGHATELAEEYASRGYRYIIGVGGDGTMNEIARALIGKPEVVTGIIPAGTGNDFVQILGFPDRLGEPEWEAFFDRRMVSMDVGTCNGQYFLNGMGLGFDAEVAARNYTSPEKVKRGGKHKYIWHIIETLLFFREKRMTIESGGKTVTSTCFMNTVAIGRRFAGGFFITPAALANDGLLDVCNVKKINLLQRFRILLMVPEGKHIRNPKVDYYQTDHLSITFDHDVPYHVDGELGYGSRFDIRLIPGALRMIYHSGGPHFFRI